MKKIALSGKKGSGKDTVAFTLSHLLPNSRLEAFAVPLKVSYAMLYDIPLEKLHERKPKEQYRNSLISFAEHLKKYDPDIFINYILRRLKDSVKSETFIVSDVRFKREAEALKKEGFKIIRVERIVKDEDSDPSETEMDDYNFDLTIQNKGNREALHQTLQQLITDNIL